MKWFLYQIRRWWLKRQLRLVHHRRQELHVIVAREQMHLDYEEAHINARLRELQTRELHSRIVRVG